MKTRLKITTENSGVVIRLKNNSDYDNVNPFYLPNLSIVIFDKDCLSKVTIKKPNKTSSVQSNVEPYKHYLEPPAHLPSDIMILNDTIGFYTFEFLQIPSAIVGKLYQVGWCIYDKANKKIFKVKTQINSFVSFSSNRTSLLEVTEDEVTDIFKTSEEFFSYHAIEKCLKELSTKVSCLVKTEVTRRDICDEELFQEFDTLYLVKSFLDSKETYEELRTKEGIDILNAARAICCKYCKTCC